jgi:hypothetical protein
MTRLLVLVLAAAVFALAPCGDASASTPTIDRVIRQINSKTTVDALDRNKSYAVLFDAYLELPEPPTPVGSRFNLRTIHPGMPDWVAVSGWAEGNPGMAEAILEAETRTVFGLPYGEENVDRKYRDADLMVRIGLNDTLRNIEFDYLHAIDAIVAFGTAESYRLLEAGRTEDGLDMTLAMAFLLRQIADRDFMYEKERAINLLTDVLSVLRDQMYMYLDDIPEEKYFEIAQKRLPFIRPGRGALFMPEADYEVAKGLLDEVFGFNDQPDREAFAEAFAGIQSAEKPLTRFGAAKRWRIIGDIHDSKQLSLERLKLIYDDWWRRWRVQEYDPILDVPTQLERTNPIRYAAVVYSIRDLESLFGARNRLIVAVNGTAASAGLCGYRATFGNYPTNIQAAYSAFFRKSNDKDFFDEELAPFHYRVLGSRFRVDTPEGQIWLEPGACILYSIGVDKEDGRGSQHTPDGQLGDLVLWPPMRALQRENGLRE